MVIYIFKTGHRVNLLILVIDLHIVAYIYSLYILLKRHVQQYFSYIVAVSFIGGGSHQPVASH
jgi:hypothetical protein